MSRRKTIDEVQLEQEKLEQEMKVRQQKLKALKRQAKEEERNQRTHRLCVHGAMLEQYLSPVVYSDEQIGKILQAVFNRSETVEMLNSIRRTNEERSEATGVPL